MLHVGEIKSHSHLDHISAYRQRHIKGIRSVHVLFRDAYFNPSRNELYSELNEILGTKMTDISSRRGLLKAHAVAERALEAAISECGGRANDAGVLAATDRLARISTLLAKFEIPSIASVEAPVPEVKPVDGDVGGDRLARITEKLGFLGFAVIPQHELASLRSAHKDAARLPAPDLPEPPTCAPATSPAPVPDYSRRNDPRRNSTTWCASCSCDRAKCGHILRSDAKDQYHASGEQFTSRELVVNRGTRRLRAG